MQAPPTRYLWFFLIMLMALSASFGYGLAALFIGMAFVPALLYLNWFRNFEKHDPEPWGALYQAFFWGAITGIILAGVVNSILIVMVSLVAGAAVAMVVAVVIIAPFVEEFLKAMGLMRAGVKEEVDEVEDGLIYGAACGLGFAATENLMYGWSVVGEGVAVTAVVIVMRTFSATLVHASATSFTGHGLSQYLVHGASWKVVAKYYLMAVGLHAFWNGMMTLGTYDILPGVGFIFALVVAIGALQFSRSKIQELDEKRVELTYQQKLDQQPGAGDWWTQSRDKWEGRGVAWGDREAARQREQLQHEREHAQRQAQAEQQQAQRRTTATPHRESATDGDGWATYHQER
ncbi:MAG: PrsW family intramembrane metalloprotease [Candidatus Poseidoniia archaeon]|jgi:RsiW-degrading membrane proteinase PrsW (M82 family)|nr:PrsW family intramembrane metalloprotease [Candidatus Poseidoniia archaeon]MDP6658672.1 PrsW family intramembrane metalloprotease [Candidatus Poseidoniia archaeon]MDP6847039.1 PrsW family intramembrane metalloprotease [Candidatus Poseidoniia archaeon]MDP7007842.1 PrsW family intramembrane metalloprotease [Candidatus Poseidoniia archaeon]|tara:strand:- start:2512 stop:3552 length:1041 start_codon:yes stop_codon:yes gene_type:complete